MLERWRERDVFARSLAEPRGAEVWSFYEGPPTANGRPGSHHVLARVFKDIYPRYRTMRGYRVPRKAGWDCHGLPVELEVEKQLGISSKQEIEEFGIAEFNQRCRESVFEYVEEWNRLTERIGFWIDLDDPYVTLEDDYIESVWWSLRQLWDKGRLYEGHKVVPYCPRDGTPLSSHEVAQGYQDVEDPSIYVRFPLLDERGDGSGESLLVWTTTPWTLPGNEAVAVAPDVTYVRARLAGETLIVAKALVERVLGEDAEVLEELEGGDLVGRELPRARLRPRRPLEPGGFPVVAGDFVTTEDGTGLVHIAPAFGEDDYRVGAENGLFDPTVAGTLYNPVSPDGTFDRRVIGFARRVRQRPRGDPRADRRPRRPRPALPRAGLRALLPALLALRHAAPLLRDLELVRRAPPRSRSGCSPTTRRSAGTPSTSSTAASANGSRTTSTGRSPATATGARRCRSGAAPSAAAASSSASARSPSCASAPGARSPRTCTAPTSTRSSSTARSAAARCAASTR